jgi:hypothetical protein
METNADPKQGLAPSFNILEEKKLPPQRTYPALGYFAKLAQVAAALQTFSLIERKKCLTVRYTHITNYKQTE